MKHGARLENSICLAVSMVLCLATLFYTAVYFNLPVHAMRGTVTASVSSSPSSGPVGAIITVSASGWPDPDGEQVSFGYMIAYSCSIVTDSQAGTFHGGSFSGWFRWPGGTPIDPYTVCANIDSTPVTANTYTVLSESAPQVFIAPTILTAGKPATITGSNYFPAGTTVQLSWETMNGSVVLAINPAISNANSAISRTFIVPTTIRSSGSYKIVAIAGGGQPPTLSSSATFTYNAPAPNPTPTPTPSPTPTQQPSPTATTPVMTPTTGSTTSTSGATGSTTSTSGATGNTTSTNQPNNTILLIAVVGSLALLVAILAIVLLIRRKKARSKRKKEREVSALGPTANGVLPWQNGLIGTGNMPSSMPGWPAPSVYGGSMSPTPVRQAVYTNNGPSPLGGQSTQLSPQSMQYSPYVHLLQKPVEGSAGNVNDYAAIAPGDPTLEVMKRQAQMGLYATSRQRQNETSLS